MPAITGTLILKHKSVHVTLWLKLSSAPPLHLEYSWPWAVMPYSSSPVCFSIFISYPSPWPAPLAFSCMSAPESCTTWTFHWIALLLLLLLSHFSRVRLCATPYTAAHQAPPSLGFSRQEHWLLLLLSRFSRVRLRATPQTAAHQAPLFLGFSKQEY